MREMSVSTLLSEFLYSPGMCGIKNLSALQKSGVSAYNVWLLMGMQLEFKMFAMVNWEALHEIVALKAAMF